MFLIAVIVSAIFLKLPFTAFYLVLAVVCYFRAKQYAVNFVKTVNRLLIAQSNINSVKISNE
jgi:hypothetical protein